MVGRLARGRGVGLGLGVLCMCWSGEGWANPRWQLVFSEVNTGNLVAGLSAVSGTHAWAVGITTQSSSQTPAGWRTTDGVNWGPMMLPAGGGGALEFTVPTQLAFLDVNTGWMSGVRFSPAGGERYLIWRTTTGGMSWDEIREAPHEVGHIQTTSDWGMFAVSGPTLLRTLDGATFEEVEPVLPSGMELESVHMFSAQCGFLLAAPSDGTMGTAVLWTSDGGESWETRSENREYRLRRTWFVSPRLGWASGERSDRGILAKTTDGGETWTTLNAPDHPPLLGQTAVATSCEDVKFFDDKRGVALCLACMGGCDPEEEGAQPSYLTILVRTNDGGATWEMDGDYEAEMSAPPFPEMSKVSGMFAMSFPDPNNGFMAGQNNLILRYTADNPEPAAWAPPSCVTGEGGSGPDGGGDEEAGGEGAGESGCGCRTGGGSLTWLAGMGIGLMVLGMRRRLG